MATHYLLIVTHPRYVAGAVWRTGDGPPKCVECAPILGWMRRADMSPEKIKVKLEREGATWEWFREDRN